MLLWTRRLWCGLGRRFGFFTLVAFTACVLFSVNLYVSVSHKGRFTPQSSASAVSPTVQKMPAKEEFKLTDAVVINSTRFAMTTLTIPANTHDIPTTLTTWKKTLVMRISEKPQTSAEKIKLTSVWRGDLSSVKTPELTSVWRGDLSSVKTPEEGYREIKFRTDDKNLRYFQTALTGQNLRILLETMDAFTAALDQNNIPYLMYAGTLIGSWRHHGIIPWDDDMDFAVPIDQQQSVYRLLMDLKPRFILDVKQKKRWKLFHEKAHPIGTVPWKFPFLDINFYHENSSYVWDYDVAFRGYKYPKEWVFPLKRRPFCGRMLWSPGQPEKTLRQTYQIEQCQSSIYSHQKERFIARTEQRTVACEKLYSLLPFVKRTPVETGCNETLEQDSRVHSYFLDSDGC